MGIDRLSFNQDGMVLENFKLESKYDLLTIQ